MRKAGLLILALALFAAASFAADAIGGLVGANPRSISAMLSVLGLVLIAIIWLPQGGRGKTRRGDEPGS